MIQLLALNKRPLQLLAAKLLFFFDMRKNFGKNRSEKYNFSGFMY